MLAPGLPARGETDPPSLEPVVVTAERRATGWLSLTGNNSRIDGSAIELVGPTHITEIMYRSPGVWISRGSGQEHLTAIRSPVLTGPGSCGAFLFMENGLSLRPVGFCNVNELFEVNSEQADAIEVVRGPAGNLYGSNALHGMLNVFVAEPGPARRISLEYGQKGYTRGKLDWGAAGRTHAYRVLVNATHDGGWRDDSGYDQQKANLAWRTDLDTGSLRLDFAATNLNQETAGFIQGKNAYRDRDLSESNPFPEAYRDAESQRVSGDWRHSVGDRWALLLRPYARRSRMDFLQHFLPGQPVEKNGQDSAGLELTLESRRAERLIWQAGIAAEYAQGFLQETQAAPITEGSPFLQATRPAGKHYDYDVDSLMLAGFGQVGWQLAPRWRSELSARYEYLRYDYDNRMLDGNTDENGVPCGFGGCIFYRPPDGRDSFLNLAPRIAISWTPAPRQQLYLAATRGFRAPQATELYRLQREQQTDPIDSETMDSLELGWRWVDARWLSELVGFYMRKDNVILRDAEGFNVSDGRTLHQGLELDLRLLLTDTLEFAADATFARHVYDFDRLAGGGEIIEDGNYVDTAPQRLASLRLLWRYVSLGQAELEWLYNDGYYLDAANEHRYKGHTLLNLRIQQALSPAWEVTLRVINLTDERYAERADFAFGSYRYLPGRERAAYLELSWRGL